MINSYSKKWELKEWVSLKMVQRPSRTQFSVFSLLSDSLWVTLLGIVFLDFCWRLEVQDVCSWVPTPQLQESQQTEMSRVDSLVHGHKLSCFNLLKSQSLASSTTYIILDSRDITLSTKVRLVKPMVFPAVMYGCENWIIKKVEHQRINAFEL